jgi:6-phosphogluconate dehydrogenase
MKADIGLIGLAVMGENLALNMESKGFTVAVYNRSVPGEEGVVDRFVNGRGKGKHFIGTHSIEQLVDSVKSPHIIRASCRRANLATTPFPFAGRCDYRRRQF